MLTSGSTARAFIAPPAELRVLAADAFAGIRAGCPKTWPTVDAEDARTGTGDWRILTPADNQFAAHLTQVSATCGGTVYLKAPDLEPDAASRTRDHDGERHRMGLPRRDPKDKPETSPRG